MGSGISSAHTRVPTSPDPPGRTRRFPGRRQRKRVPGRVPFQVSFANDVTWDSRLLKTSLDYQGIFRGKSDGPGMRFGERSGKWPIFLIALKIPPSLQGTCFLCKEHGILLQEQRDQTHRATRSKCGLKKRSQGQAGWGGSGGRSSEAGPL